MSFALAAALRTQLLHSSLTVHTGSDGIALEDRPQGKELPVVVYRVLSTTYFGVGGGRLVSEVEVVAIAADMEKVRTLADAVQLRVLAMTGAVDDVVVLSSSWESYGQPEAMGPADGDESQDCRISQLFELVYEVT